MKNARRASRALRFLLLVLLAAALAAPAAPARLRVVTAASSGLVISQVYGGGGNTGAPYRNDFIELFNRGAAPVNLAGKSVQYTSATGPGQFSSNVTALPNVTLQPGGYFLVQEGSGGGSGAALPPPDQAGIIAMSTSAGKVALVNSPVGLACNGGSAPCPPEEQALIIDLVGYGVGSGGANFFEGAGPAPGLNNILADQRKDGGCQETDHNSFDFSALAPLPRNTAYLAHLCGPDEAPAIASVSPLPGAVGVGWNANITVAFTEPVTTGPGWLALTCEASGAHVAQPSGGPVTFTLDPQTDFAAGENCAVNIQAALITDQDADDPPDAMLVDYAWSFSTLWNSHRVRDIQGAAHLSPLLGQVIPGVSGIVTALRSNGFFLQDPDPDGSPATSEGIFVYTTAAPTVLPGDSVIASGMVSEYRYGGALSDSLTVTEITSPATAVLSHGNPLPAPILIGAGGRLPPDQVIEDDSPGDVEAGGDFDPAADGIDFYESLEGMRVQVDDAVVVGPRSSFGEITVIGDGGESAGLRTARGGLVIRAEDANPERVILDDAIIGAQAMPQASVGDFFQGAVVGVMDYSSGNFKIDVTQLPAAAPGGLARESASPPAGDTLSVATFNVENLAPGDPPEKFNRLAALIVSNLKSPDLLAIEEVQDNSGAANDGVVAAGQTWEMLVTAIQAAGGPSYAYRQVDPQDNQDGGAPGGNIRQGFLFRTDRGLSFNESPDGPGGPASANSILVTAGTAHLKYNPGRVDPVSAAFNQSRKPLAAEFNFRGRRLFVIANHFVSRGADSALFGRYQPPRLSSQAQRIQQAQVVNAFVDSILAAEPRATIIVLGDLNDDPFSQSLAVLAGGPPVLHDLVLELAAAEQYSYVYDGNSQALDHILVSDALYSYAFLYDSIHANAEFADRASDHDPQLLVLRAPPPLYLPLVARP